MRRASFALVLTFCALRAAAQQPAPAKAEVLVLGTYHMANPGRDIYNTQADDVLTPKRQAEIAQVIETLKKFRPTKIAIESTVGEDRRTKQYADYVAGKHELSRNEIEQIGFRLAKELGHETIHPVDVDGEFPWMRVGSYAKASGRSAELDALKGEVGAMVEAQSRYLASHTILEVLLSMNADAKVAQDVGFYFRQAEFSEPYDWAGADLVSEWFKRNVRIYSNVMQLVSSPNERILVIYGAGHLGWLQYAFGSNPRLRLRKLSEFATH